MKMFRYILFSLVIVTVSFSVLYAQQDPDEQVQVQKDEKSAIPLKDRFFFGGGLGLQFGSATFIDVSPMVGYKITERLQAGVGVTYIYYKVKDTQYNYSYETSIYGGRVFGRYYFLENLFGHTEFEVLNLETPRFNYSNNEVRYIRENITSVLIGGGYAQPIGSNASLVIMALWNLTEQQYSPYQNPIFRIGLNAGF